MLMHRGPSKRQHPSRRACHPFDQCFEPAGWHPSEARQCLQASWILSSPSGRKMNLGISEGVNAKSGAYHFLRGPWDASTDA